MTVNNVVLPPFVNPGNILIVLLKNSVKGTKQSVAPSAVSRFVLLKGLHISSLSFVDEPLSFQSRVPETPAIRMQVQWGTGCFIQGGEIVVLVSMLPQNRTEGLALSH